MLVLTGTIASILHQIVPIKNALIKLFVTSLTCVLIILPTYHLVVPMAKNFFLSPLDRLSLSLFQQATDLTYEVSDGSASIDILSTKININKKSAALFLIVYLTN